MKKVTITGTIERPTKREYTTTDGVKKPYLTFNVKNTEFNKTTFINVSCFNKALLKDKAEQLLEAKGYWLIEGDLNSYKKQDDTWGMGINMTNCIKIDNAPKEEEDAIIWE